MSPPFSTPSTTRAPTRRSSRGTSRSGSSTTAARAFLDSRPWHLACMYTCQDCLASESEFLFRDEIPVCTSCFHQRLALRCQTCGKSCVNEHYILRDTAHAICSACTGGVPPAENWDLHVTRRVPRLRIGGV
eukprot:c9672_g1_i1.p2 GENE.c9672_g1_i1~~c9672_g1_i1.p2  ORF type:complete len:132 (+),score=10.06 c9672_g1_i1:113-508(+)